MSVQARISKTSHDPDANRLNYIPTGIQCTHQQKKTPNHPVDFIERAHQINATKPDTRTEILKKIKRVKEKIDSSFQDEITLETLSRDATLSKYHFIRNFKNIYGCTPYHYLLIKRLEFASQLLKNKNTPIGNVAFLCGFKSRRSFSKAFKNFFGINPSESCTKPSPIQFRAYSSP